MATKYDDIIKLRGGKAAYVIADEKDGEWTSFIPNEQFNTVLRTVLKSVRGNDIDNHKSFWINGTYGTGKSHAVAVISHLLCDSVDDIRDWVDYEYGDEKFTSIRQAIYKLREEKRLLTVKVYGLSAMTHTSDLALVLQKAVTSTLEAKGINVCVPTDFESYIEQIKKEPEIWEHRIEANTRLSSIVTTTEQLINKLADGDLGTFHRVTDTLRAAGLDVRMSNDNLKQWLIEVQNKLAELGEYSGLLIIWDEFTDVMKDPIGLPVLKELQDVAERFMSEENDSYMFLISHPSAFNGVDSEQLKQTDGRYHRLKYNMEPVSAFKIMSRKFEIVDKERHSKMSQSFYSVNSYLLDVFTATSNDALSTKEDLFNLFPLHPGTANLATHYATVVGSSSRSVFEFLGQNDAIRTFLDDEDVFFDGGTITADYLWDYVLKVFQDDVTNYGAVTERYNSYMQRVGSMGRDYFAVFKGVLLLNAFNNVSGENNNGLVTPSEDNIHALFAGTSYGENVDNILAWFNEEGIIQRAPGGMYSVQFSALPSGEIEEKKDEMRMVQYRFTHQILNFSDVAKNIFEKKFMQKVIRPFAFKFYSDVQNESQLRSQIKNGKKEQKSSSLFFALLLARNNTELATLRTFAEKCSVDQDDKDLKNIVFIVFDEVMTDIKYEQFIEFQANYACASSHGFLDQQKVHKDHAMAMVKEWMESVQRNNATVYINGEEKQPISVKHLSSVVNSGIAPVIFPYGPDAHEILRQKAPSTFWKQQNSKEMVRTFLFATTKSEFASINQQMRPVQYLIQDCLDENLNWKSDVLDTHPFKAACDKVSKIIKYADKSLPFNFDDKFSVLTQPPYGFYGSFAAMGIIAFALRPWINKIFDPQGKPRDANALIDDIVLLFKVWDDNKSNSKLNFKFQTPEEGKLCKELISLFKLNNKGNAYSDVTSLKDARFAITGDFLAKKNNPLWTLKYASPSAFAGLPIAVTISDSIKNLIDNIVQICMERELRNPALVNQTLALIEELRIEMKNILNVEDAFNDGFKNFLMQIEFVNVQEHEIGEVRDYIAGHLESTVGYWTEDEVIKSVKDWRLEQKLSVEHPVSEPSDIELELPIVNVDILNDKRQKAKDRIVQISSLVEAKEILMKLCETSSEWVLDKINS
ncbi:MAG: hypothetical protein IKV80_08945 [Bacteroidales bacterium]|nr:hypothetical protein [Bacteroidales bacterium]